MMRWADAFSSYVSSGDPWIYMGVNQVFADFGGRMIRFNFPQLGRLFSQAGVAFLISSTHINM